MRVRVCARACVSACVCVRASNMGEDRLQKKVRAHRALGKETKLIVLAVGYIVKAKCGAG